VWEGCQNFLNCSLLSNHVEVNILLICKCLVRSSHYRASGFFFFFLFIGISYSKWRKFSFLFVLRYSCKRCVFIYIYSVFLIEFAGSVGISLAGQVMYIFRVSLRYVEWRAGSILFDHCGGVGGGTVQVFLLLWLCSGGYSTVEMVRGGWSVFPFAFSSLLSVLLAVGYLR
jgi:hypothetical protein